MSNSKLVSYTKISPNRTSPRNHVIDTITIHCVVGQASVETLGNVFAPTSRKASSNYGVGVDGRIGMYCEEKDRSWCSSSASNDNRAITIEVASDTTHPYAVNEKAYAALIELLVDICKRNGIKELKWKADKSLIGQVDKQNMTVHRWFANKSCPGDYLYERHGEIARLVNERLGVVPTPAPVPSHTSFKVGDLVQFTGGKVYSSSNAAKAAVSKGTSRCKVTQTYNGKHPYHLISQDGGGVYGWVDGADIAAIGSPMPLPPLPPEKPVGDKSDPSAVQQTVIKVGGKVKVLKAQTYTGGTFKTYYSVYDVLQVNGDRVVIGIGKTVTAAVKSSNLQPV